MVAAPSSATAQNPSFSNNSASKRPHPTEALFQDFVGSVGKFIGQMDLQRTWGLSHVAFLSLAALYVFNAALFGSRLLGLSYRLAMLCLLTGYGIAVKRHVGHFMADMHTLERAMSYDGTPYFCLALMWWMMAAHVPITLLPLSIYSCYHAIAWAKDDSVIKQSSEWRKWGESVCIKMTSHQSSLLFAAAHLEIASLPYMLLAWIFAKRGPGIAQLLFYLQFLRWQVSVSPKIRAAAKQWEAGWEAAVQHPSCPKNIRDADKWVRQQLRVLGQVSNPGGATGLNKSTSGSRPAFPGAGSKKFN